MAVLEFAVLGHPNEGKSSVVSTLTEDDRIKVSPVPGETTVSRKYTVRIDGKETIRFVDTPGFQVPRQTLAWFEAYDGDQGKIVERFIETFKGDPFFADECELLGPVAEGAGIIYVADGARPVRDDDIAEMEILRLTGRPRMAIINCKTERHDYTSDWHLEFRKHFNSIRLFNSNTANFTERIRMLESLKAIDQEWEPVLSNVILAFQEDWRKRNRLVCAYIIQSIEQSLSYSVSEAITESTGREEIENKLNAEYQVGIRDLEKQMFKKLRALFKHNLFEFNLSDYSILRHDLFSRQTWELLGLTKQQLAGAGAVVGGTLGAVIDAAAAGITFGVFTALGGILGAGSALLGAKKMANMEVAGVRFGGDGYQLGPNRNPQFLYVLLDRALIYYSHMVNRPHGRRDASHQEEQDGTEKRGYTTGFAASQRNVCARFHRAVSGSSFVNKREAMSDFGKLMESTLTEISK